jgi:hypothetical protein
MEVGLVFFQERVIDPIDDFDPVAVEDTRIPATEQAGTDRLLEARRECLSSAE